MTHAHETPWEPEADTDAPDEPLEEALSVYDDEGEDFMERSQRRLIQARRERPARQWY